MNVSRGFQLRIAAILICGTLLSIVPASITNAQYSRPTQGEHLVKLEIKQLSVLDGLKSIRVSQGERIRLHWTSDEAVVLHLHGYDIEISLFPNTPSEMTLEAGTTGRFPITSHGFGASNSTHHDHKLTLIYLEVYPN